MKYKGKGNPDVLIIIILLLLSPLLLLFCCCCFVYLFTFGDGEGILLKARRNHVKALTRNWGNETGIDFIKFCDP